MEVKLSHKGSWFEATNTQGAMIKMGPVSEDVVSPMEAVLMAAGGCSAIDLVGMLEKMRQPLTGLEITVSGERRQDHPRYFRSILIKYLINGKVDADKAKRAIELSLEKYCSVTNSLEPKVNIHYELEIQEGD